MPATVVYECANCGERTAGERRCPDCNLFTTRLGSGGHCPECDEIILIDELFNHQPTAPSDTDNLTSGCRAHANDNSVVIRGAPAWSRNSTKPSSMRPSWGIMKPSRRRICR